MNGKMQTATTVIAAIFVAGTLWARIGANAAAMRATMEEIRVEQREMHKMIETLIRQKP
jgi:hypothetical protein